MLTLVASVLPGLVVLPRAEWSVGVAACEPTHRIRVPCRCQQPDDDDVMCAAMPHRHGTLWSAACGFGARAFVAHSTSPPAIHLLRHTLTHTTHAPAHTHARGSVFSPRLALRPVDPTRQPPHASGLPIRPNPHSPDPRINTLMPSPTYLRRSSLRDLQRRRRPKSSRS